MGRKVKVGINGFGRIGRYFAKLVIEHPDIDLVAINDLSNQETLAHLLKYDSVHGRYEKRVQATDQGIEVEGKLIALSKEKNPADISWSDHDVEIVIESTGLFRTKDHAEKHIGGSVKKVIISAPSPDQDIKMVVMGINDDILNADDQIVSNASCTTNSAAPLVKIIHDLATIQSCFITTVHSFTSDQRLHDAPHKDLRRARAATQSIVPTSTGAAKAITRIFPDLSDVIGGCGIRVPVPDGSLTDMTFVVDRSLTVDQINEAFYQASNGSLSHILDYTSDPIVSVDILGNKNSCVFDAELTSVIGNMVKVVGWYDNEAGYSNRLVDLVLKLKEI